MQRHPAIIAHLSAIGYCLWALAYLLFRTCSPAQPWTSADAALLAQGISYTWDPDATNWLAGQGITATADTSNPNSRVSTNINRLVLDAKTNGWWSRCDIIYPFIQPYGAWPSTTNNLRSSAFPSNAFNFTIGGTVATNANGIVFAGGGYLKTGYQPSASKTAVSTSPTNVHIFCYIAEGTTSTKWAIGGNNTATDSLGILVLSGNGFCGYPLASLPASLPVNLQSVIGGVILTRTNSNASLWFQGTNSAVGLVTSTNTAYSTADIYVGGRSYGNAPLSYFTGTIAGFTLGASIPTNTVPTFLADWSRYQAGMGRRGY